MLFIMILFNIGEGHICFYEYDIMQNQGREISLFIIYASPSI